MNNKYTNMNNKYTKPQLQANNDHETDEKGPENTHKAFAMYRDPKDTKYVLVEVSFNPEASNVKELNRDVREDVIDKLKMQIADNFFGDM